MLHRLLVKPHPGVSDSDFRTSIDDNGGTVVDEDMISSLGVYVAEFDVPDTKGTLIAALRSHRHFKFAEPDTYMASDLTPDDPSYASQTNLTQINVAAAWDISTGAGVIIGICDSGVDGTHPDLADNMVAGYNFYDGNTTTTDVRGHGTAVAGVAAAALNNTTGMAGVAGDAQIMPLRVSDLNGGALWSTVAKAIQYAADHGCRVVNLSYSPSADAQTIQTAAAYLLAAGGVLVCAAGNTGAENTSPQTTVLVDVGSINSDNTLSSFSTYGNIVHCVAPGNNVLSTKNGGGYGLVSGTSFSAPTVAGVLALIFSANPDLTAAQAISILLGNVTDLGTAGRDKYFGYGKVNAGVAVAAAAAADSGSTLVDTTAPTVSISSPSAGTTQRGVVTVAVTATDNVGVDHVEFYVAGMLQATDSLAPFSFQWDTTAGTDGTKSLTAKAYDAAGNSATSAAVSVTVSNASDSTAPTVTISSPSNGATIGNKNVKVSASASDANGIASMQLLLDGVVVASSTGSTSISYAWNARKATAGTHTFTATARDPSGNTGTRSITVTKS